ncbi:phenylacetate--CoA ligase family protein [Flavicella sediminum]|uniref:phenylacetate--CoA ligase family protein n=1 Tax=Flavicella sediminum TaxID=2585141 RepID=UPI00111D5F5E|nr:phenylacetate--CoA ligase family protein [Flavicella sediminum]
MFKKKINKLFYNSPIWIQNVCISCYGYYRKNRRFGGVFSEYVAVFLQNEKKTAEAWKDYQTQELRKLLVHAFETVPYYKELYTKHGFTIEDFKNFELSQLPKLPYLEKEALRKFGENKLLSLHKKPGGFYSSSGSTGTPTKIYFSKYFHQIWSAAYEVRIRKWAGIDKTMNRGMIGGRKIGEDSSAKAPFYRFNAAEKQTYFSAYHISLDTVDDYVAGFVKNKVEYLVGYAMSIYYLADFIVQKKIEVPKQKAVITSSEKLTSEMRTVIEKAFQCKVYDSYSGVEACGLISENSFGELIFSQDTGIMEVVDAHGNEVLTGENGEVIATGLLNFDQPLIRYRIGDCVTMAKEQKSKSNVQMPIVKEISGRTEDTITTLDGRKMVRFHSIFTDIEHLKQGQIIQNSLSEFELNCVVHPSFSKESENEMRTRLKKQIGEQVQIKFNYLDTIPLMANGKFRAVISKIEQ